VFFEADLREVLRLEHESRSTINGTASWTGFNRSVCGYSLGAVKQEAGPATKVRSP
jgi:hypothetical protein